MKQGEKATDVLEGGDPDGVILDDPLGNKETMTLNDPDAKGGPTTGNANGAIKVGDLDDVVVKDAPKGKANRLAELDRSALHTTAGVVPATGDWQIDLVKMKKLVQSLEAEICKKYKEKKDESGRNKLKKVLARAKETLSYYEGLATKSPPPKK